MNDRTVAVKPFWDVAAQAWDVVSFVKDAPGTALWLLSGARYLFTRWRRKKPGRRVNWVLVSDTPGRPDLGCEIRKVPIGKTPQEVLDEMNRP